MTRRVILLSLLVALSTAAAIVSACGSSTNTSTLSTASPVKSTLSAVIQTPGAGGGTLATATSAPPVKIAAHNIRFDHDTLMASPGTIRIEFDNNDNGIMHDFAVYKSASDTSSPLGATPITAGPDKQTLTLTLDQGEYYYQCQVHPQQMHGTLIVH